MDQERGIHQIVSTSPSLCNSTNSVSKHSSASTSEVSVGNISRTVELTLLKQSIYVEEQGVYPIMEYCAPFVTEITSILLGL